MSFKAANWTALLCAVMTLVFFGLFIYTRDSGITIPVFSRHIKVIVLLPLMTATVLFMARIIALKRDEKRLDRKTLATGAIFVAVIMAFRLLSELMRG